jgi:hypothetical protein
MRIQLYIISLIIYLLLPYYVFAKQQNKKNVKEAPAYIADAVESDEKDGACFHCNSFVTDAFTLSFKLKTLLKNKNNFFNISKQPVINMHDSSVVDTAFDFSNRKNEISIYKASHSEMINRFDISDRRFYLKGSISIGMTKENFKTKFSLKSLKGDTIIISDEDNIVRFTFYFKKSALVRITYKAMID